MLYLTFDLELHDPIKNLNNKIKNNYILEQELILRKIFSKINNNKIKLSCFVTNEFVDVYNDFLHNYIIKYHEIGCHTADHLFYNFNNYSEFIENIRENKAKLEREIGCKCKGFRAPGGIVPNNLIEILKKMDFKYDSSILPGLMIGRFYNYGCPRNPYYPSLINIFYPNEKNKEIIEFPLLTSDYLRLSVNGVLFSIYYKFINLDRYEDNYGTLYFHPIDFKKFRFFEKSYFWDKIKITQSYWDFLNEYINRYKNLDLRLVVFK